MDAPLNVLLVEDNPGDADFISEALLEAGGGRRFRVATVETVAAAAAHFAANPSVDVVLLDLTLPDSKGIATLQQLRVHAPDVPVVILTGTNDEALGLGALRAGAQDYLIKGQGDGALIARALLFAIERRQLEVARYQLAEARVARTAAENALRSRDDFITIAAHELRTPLTAVVIQLRILRRIAEREVGEAGDSKLLAQIDRANRYSHRLVKLIDRLLDLSRVSVGKLDLDFGLTDLCAVVREVVERYDEGGNAFQLNFPPAAVGQWDRMRIEEVVENLVSNAVKYGRGEPIEIEVQSDGDWIRLYVKDRGIGLSRDDAERVFERFERAVSVDNYGGLGIGLYVAREIVELHGGRIRVTSTPGVGSTFTVELPRNGEAQRIGLSDAVQRDGNS